MAYPVSSPGTVTARPSSIEAVHLSLDFGPSLVISAGTLDLASSISYPADLPITPRKDEIVAAIRDHQVIVLAGETGSGKTTQIPKMCLEAGLGRLKRIGCTQPRRVAALSVARRVAQELRVNYGREVGAKIRFNDQTSRDTRIKFMTDGILLAETQGDSDLREYDCLVIDEAHERSLNIDFLLGYLKLLLSRRPDLKLIITSATIETAVFSAAFNSAPIIEVSGRMYPVELLYRPFDHLAEELGDFTCIDAAVHAVEELLASHPPGDILIFMPGEKDIRETRDLLQGRFAHSHEIIPLFGRLSSGEQDRVFAPGPLPRITIATNIAETSLTIPRIRYVIDSGLARLSRYSPRTRTKRLPIEPVSQSSADQRKGRCGRVAEGLCIRLYSEEEFAARPKYTQPEIQRANLAEVILRMKAFHLGDIETFPFLNPPQPAAISTGYKLLHELGALDDQENLTPLGWDLARLPVDPSIGRMIIQAVRERALSEVLVIAAGLSIQDPRERPMDQKEAAEQAHRRFAKTNSDFLVLLNIWNAYHDEFERLGTQNQVRRFCRSHFLSYLRMREWVDIHRQLEEALESIDFTSIGETVTSLKAPAHPDRAAQAGENAYAAIHRSILSGLLSHIAEKRERNLYCATGNREAMLFPGSVLFDKAPPQKSRQSPEPKQTKTSQPNWVVAGEIVETTRLYARTVAGIDPNWVAELGEHICKFNYIEPHFSEREQRVLAREKVLLGGLELISRLVPYSKVNPVEATEIFLRDGLAADKVNAPHGFIVHNRQLREKIESWQTRSRQSGLLDLDHALFVFYKQRIQNVSSVHDLNAFIKEQGRNDRTFLCASEQDLIGATSLHWDQNAFPEQISLAGHPIQISYAYAPGETHDGATLHLPVTLAQHLKPGELEWAIPGWREEQIRELLRALPKSLRVPLMPLEPKVREIADSLQPGSDSLLAALSQFIRHKYKVQVTPASWPPNALPEHLRPRVSVTGPGQKIIAETRDASQLHEKLQHAERNVETAAWDRAVQQWERYELISLDNDLPAEIKIPTQSGVPLLAYPALVTEEGAVSLRLLRNRDEAIHRSRPGLQKLAELALQKEMGWIQKDLRALNSVKDLYITLGSPDELLETAFQNIRNHLLEPDTVYPLTQAALHRLIAQAQERLPGLIPKFTDLVAAILKLRQQILLSPKKYPGMIEELNALTPKQFLARTPYPYLLHLPRYLRALLLRAERANQNPAREQERIRQVIPFIQTLQGLRQRKDLGPQQTAALEQFRWMIEELKVSLFAQELGTPQPVSPKRLNSFLQEKGLAL